MRRRTQVLVVLAVAVLLCALPLWLAVRALSDIGGDPASAAEPATTEPSSQPPDPTGAVASAPPAESDDAQVQWFASPSGNISCLLSVEGARCDIAAKDWTPPPAPADCTAVWAVGLVLSSEGAEVLCAGDTALGATEVLGYGETLRAGAVSCTSSRESMACNLDNGPGFTLARGSYTVS